MENIDNNIIVNAKPYKVLLQTSEDGVEGGYYDADETWHEFGGGESDILNVTISFTDTSTLENIQLMYVLEEGPTEDTPEGFQRCKGLLVDTEGTYNLKVLKNSFISYLYEGETSWLKMVSGTGKSVEFYGDTYLYFDEDGQNAVLDYYFVDE